MEKGKKIFLEHLYTLHAETLYKIAYMKLNFDEERAKEIVQETFFEACLKVDKLYEVENPLKWLIQVEIYMIKRENFRLWTGKTKDGIYKFSREVNIDTILEEDLPIENVDFCKNFWFEDLKKILSTREMIFIEKRYLKDKAYKQIAADLNITETACTSFGSRVHKKIKKFLKKRDKTSRNFDI